MVRVVSNRTAHHRTFTPWTLAAAKDQDAPQQLPTVMVATLVRDGSSWSRGRSFQSYLEMLDSFDYPNGLMSVALLASDPAYYKQLEHELPGALKAFGFAQITLMQRNVELAVPAGEDRHGDKFQRERRRGLARLRNFLLFTALRSEQAVLWLDADVLVVPPGVLRKAAVSGRDIVAVRCMQSASQEYDLNTWRGSRMQPTAQEREGLARGERFVPRPDKVEYLKAYGERGQEWVQLDSVGATFLYVNSVAHREGVVFATHYAVGSEWAREGYDGIESEGLCYLARFLGYQCWGIATEFTMHTDRRR
jgi:mannan polymerase complexes MNN9 subunit